MSGVLRSRRPLPLKLNQSILEFFLCVAAVLRHKKIYSSYKDLSDGKQNFPKVYIFLNFLCLYRNLTYHEIAAFPCESRNSNWCHLMAPSHPHLLWKFEPHRWSRKLGISRKPPLTTPQTRTPSSGFFVAGAERALTRSLLPRYINSFFTPICILFE